MVILSSNDRRYPRGTKKVVKDKKEMIETGMAALNNTKLLRRRRLALRWTAGKRCELLAPTVVM